jgi:acyl phosphate:glycerol-3-phosphate acyltransferase
MPMLITAVTVAYLLGSISTAILVCRALGLSDPRAGGSGNPGATNVLRLHGRLPAALTLAGDVLKGLLPVATVALLGGSALMLALTALAAVLGHLYPVFFGFRGGKGVATWIGVLFGMHWPLGLAHVGVWLLVAKVFRYSSLAALLATPAPFIASLLLPCELPIRIVCAVLGLLVLARHRSNIERLLAGSEGRIGGQQG